MLCDTTEIRLKSYTGMGMTGTPQISRETRGDGSPICRTFVGMKISRAIPAGMKTHFTVMLLLRFQRQKKNPAAVSEDSHSDDNAKSSISLDIKKYKWHMFTIAPHSLKSEASFCAPRRPMRAIYEQRTWQTQFPRCCTQNMELFTATSPFANHQPTTVPVWAQNSYPQTRLHMTFTSENYWGVNLYLLTY